MSFVEKDYDHGIDCITINKDKTIKVEKLNYQPQHKLRIIPENDEELTFTKLKKLIDKELTNRTNEALNPETFDYVALKIKLDKINTNEIKELENLVNSKNAVLCKIQKINTQINVRTIIGNQQMTSIEDILNRAPIETLKEAYIIKHKIEMNDQQIDMLNELINNINLTK